MTFFLVFFVTTFYSMGKYYNTQSMNQNRTDESVFKDNRHLYVKSS